MKAVILCAGYGERLKPFTNFLPKPLFPILGRPLIDNIIARLKQLGINEICINIHHLADKLAKYLSQYTDGIKIHIFYEPSILGIAGGIGNMREHLTETFIVYNGDVLTNIELKPAIEFHKREKPIITMILHNYKNLNKVAMSDDNNISSIGDDAPDKLAFTGISIMSPEVFDFLPYKKYGDIHNVYTKLIPGKLKGYIAKGNYWIDIGTPKNYLKAHKDILMWKFQKAKYKQ